MSSRDSGPAFASGVLAVALLLAGCAGGSNGGATPAAYPDINGNWGLSTYSTTYPGATAPVGVQLTEASGKVTGIAHLVSACYLITDNVPLAGTEDTSGKLTLTSAAVNGQILTITGNVASGSVLTSGTYAITGSGCGANDKGAVIGGTVSNISGTYTGSLKSTVIGASFGTTATLTQSTTVDSNGFEHLSGSATFSGSPCFATSPINTPNSDTNVIGILYSANFAASATTTIKTSGTFSPDGKALNVNYQIVGGNCNGDYGSGTLTRQ